MPIPKDPERAARWRTKAIAALKRGREPKHPCRCLHCGGPFLGRDVKSSVCDPCRAGRPCRGGCGATITGPSATRFCRSCQHKTPAGVEQRRRLHASIRGEANPAKRPEVGAKISEAIRGEKHPARRHPELFAAIGRANFPPRTPSRLERSIAHLLPGFVPQHKVAWWSIDYADPDRKVAIEVQGCWHHACPACCPAGAASATQRQTLANDKRKSQYLKARGWTLIEIWEHDIRANAEKAVAVVYDH